ncbi:hypothetical protein ACRE_075230 [Hapsidospora chrysogenum ATCC 11550]|uniref:Uncharacterized protein n=1 Tax=Hapsidospora chrysogenum (strain ATCC 11550 / CBS 779.69 / DSM 880 / IAM 14645 / JCM 23072 / IMI 49137) TaxID=857340 RepID=A0A086SXD7_HAPC1|nr:hypothetical protein ACRE_075230 [Hapsidospora chrysogenum ATCC 11550]
MSEAPRSPKRRHILSSINPEQESQPEARRKRSRRHSRSPTPTTATPTCDTERDRRSGDGHHDEDPEDRTRPRRSRLKLKDHKSRRRRRRSRTRSRSRCHHRDDNKEEHDENERSHRRDHHDHHDHHRRRRRHHRHQRRPRRSPTPPNPYEEPPLDPEAAFRESLFDAMADDEGADYWAAVYGQPVHVYPNERVGPQGELERMTDEEYAAYVRQRMWEKTHAGLLEERARREEARRRKKEEQTRQRKVQREVEESLRRGEERKERRRWADRWAEYERGWASWDGTPAALAWPVESGRREDISGEAVRAFLVHGLGLEEEEEEEEVGRKAFVSRLKEERVRWHPDKIQQRAAGGTVDEATMRDVTAIFQIIDRLWGEMRSKDG